MEQKKIIKHHSNCLVKTSDRWAAEKKNNLCYMILVLETSVHDFRREEKGKQSDVMLVSDQSMYHDDYALCDSVSHSFQIISEVNPPKEECLSLWKTAKEWQSLFRNRRLVVT